MYDLAVLMRWRARAGNAAMGNQSIVAINRPFRDRGMDPARDQRGCSTPFGNPSILFRSKLRGILD